MKNNWDVNVTDYGSIKESMCFGEDEEGNIYDVERALHPVDLLDRAKEEAKVREALVDHYWMTGISHRPAAEELINNWIGKAPEVVNNKDGVRTGSGYGLYDFIES